MSAEVKAVVFDVGRVLVEWDLRCLFSKLIEDRRELEWFVSHVVSEEWHAQHDAGRDLDEMVEERKRAFPGYEHLIDAYATRFAESIPGPVPGTHDLVERLSDHGVPLYAITNFAARFWEDFSPTEPVLRHFRDIVVSGIEKIAKPSPRIFELAARRFGHAPAEMLFIDDSLPNIETARTLGWQVHHFESARALESDLASRGLIGWDRPFDNSS